MSAEYSPSPPPFTLSTYTTARRGRVLPCVALAERVDRATWTAHHERAKSLGGFWATGHGWAFRSDEAAAAFMGAPEPAPAPVKLRVVEAPAPKPEPKPAPVKKAKADKPRAFLPVAPPKPTPVSPQAPTWAGHPTPDATINVQVGATGRYSFTNPELAAKFIKAHGGEIVGATWLDTAAPAKPQKTDKRRALASRPWAELTPAERRELCSLTPAEKATFTAVTPHAAEAQKKHAAQLAAMPVT